MCIGSCQAASLGPPPPYLNPHDLPGPLGPFTLRSYVYPNTSAYILGVFACDSIDTRTARDAQSTSYVHNRLARGLYWRQVGRRGACLVDCVFEAPASSRPLPLATVEKASDKPLRGSFTTPPTSNLPLPGLGPGLLPLHPWGAGLCLWPAAHRPVVRPHLTVVQTAHNAQIITMGGLAGNAGAFVTCDWLWYRSQGKCFSSIHCRCMGVPLGCALLLWYERQAHGLLGDLGTKHTLGPGHVEFAAIFGFLFREYRGRWVVLALVPHVPCSDAQTRFLMNA